ncbi:MAG: hypothetical protein A3I15_02775 [Chlamydiae bacterium RIFCSPLOWO2_02_FULL_49_12]|nr:MAG: hypothetical protein A3I15_02775 [Chlamydiae bacterium RIFCSPLOWO2_02_FULL_49_12]
MITKAIARRIVERLKEKGFIAYFAGGWVRDFLMKHPSDDIDIATTASVEEVRALFEKTIPVGIAFGIVIVVEEGHPFEVATFRKERGYLDGRRPTKVEPASPQEDAQRRDFTINGLFYDPTTDELFDYVEGKRDLQKGIIRAIGNPHERFLEDRLRMMRAVRYSTRFNFPIEKETKAAVLLHAKNLLPAVAIERIWQEFKKMSRFAHFDRGLVALHEFHLLQTIFPSLDHVSTGEIKKRTAAIERFPTGAPAIAELLELFPEESLEELLDLCSYLKLSKKEQEFAAFHHRARTLFSMPAEWQRRLEPYEWVCFHSDPNSELSLQILAARLSPQEEEAFLQEQMQRKRGLKEAILRREQKTTLLRAEHLLLSGVCAGKRMGELLKEGERLAVNEGLNNWQAVLKRLENGGK